MWPEGNNPSWHRTTHFLVPLGPLPSTFTVSPHSTCVIFFPLDSRNVETNSLTNGIAYLLSHTFRTRKLTT